MTDRPKVRPAPKVSAGVLANAFLNDATAYINAAQILIREKHVETPTYFLLTHALELALKAYLIASGVEIDALRKPPLNHDLKRLFEESVSRGLRVDGEHIAPLIAVLADFHGAFVLRYPVVNRDGDLIMIATLYHADEVCGHVVTILERVKFPVFDARLKAASDGGQYSIEAWHMGG